VNIKPYPLDKRLIISDQPLDELIKFTRETSHDFFQKLVSDFPSVNGFRPGHAQQEAKIKRYYNRIRIWKDTDWKLFDTIFLAWVENHVLLNKLLAAYDNTADFREGSEIIPPNSPLDIKCFEYLASKSDEYKVSRELIKRFYEYGYFKKDIAIELNIIMAKSAFELNLADIPDNIKSIQAQVACLNSTVDSLKKEILFENKMILDNRISQIENASRQDMQIVNEEIKIINNKIDDKSNQQLSELNKLADTISTVNNTIMDNLSVMVDQKYTLFEFELRDIDNKCKQYVLDSPKPDDVSIINVIPESESIKELKTPDSFVSTLSDNFRSIGMQSGIAKTFTNEIIAAFSVGQVALFRGSMAPLIANVCAQSLASHSIYRIKIPIGMFDDKDFSSTVFKVIKDSVSKTSLSILILEEINLSAPEIYGGSLKDLITERLLGLESEGNNLLIIATIMDGPAALDLTPEISEWGPIFNTDCLEWRNKWTRRSILSACVSVEAWNEWTSTLSDISDIWDNILQDYSHIGGHATILWQRCLYNAVRGLKNRVGTDNFPTIAQSLIYGWLLPRGFASHINIADIENLLSGGKVDTDKIDDRILRLLGYNQI
jgi:hypothetical protein